MFYVRRDNDQADTFHTESRELAIRVANSMAEDGKHHYRVLSGSDRATATEVYHTATRSAKATTIKLAEKAREDILKVVEEVHNGLAIMPTDDPVVFGNMVIDTMEALEAATMAAMKPLALALAKEQPKAAAAAFAALQMLGLLGPSRRG